MFFNLSQKDAALSAKRRLKVPVVLSAVLVGAVYAAMYAVSVAAIKTMRFLQTKKNEVVIR